MTRIITIQGLSPNRNIRIIVGTKNHGIRINPNCGTLDPNDIYTASILLPRATTPVSRSCEFRSSTEILLALDDDLTAIVGKARCHLVATSGNTSRHIGDVFTYTVLPLGSKL